MTGWKFYFPHKHRISLLYSPKRGELVPLLSCQETELRKWIIGVKYNIILLKSLDSGIIFEIIKSIRQRTYCGHTRQHKETDQFIFYHSISLFSPQSISEDKIFVNYQYFRSFSSRKMFLKRLKEKISLFYRF